MTLEVGSWLQRNRPCNERVGLWALTPHHHIWAWVEAGGWFNYQGPTTHSTMPVLRNLHKNPKWRCLESFHVGEHIETLGGWHTQRGYENSTPLSTSFAPCISSIWLFLSCVLHNSLVIVSKLFPWILWGPTSKLLNMSRGWVGTPSRFIASWLEVQEAQAWD